MITTTLRSVAALLGAVILGTTFGGQPAFAQSCPYFTAEEIDQWFLETTQFGDSVDRKVLCVDDPGFTTLDYFDRLAPRSLYLDVTYATSHTNAEYTVLPSPITMALPVSDGEISSLEARACRHQIVTSRAWGALNCPNN